MKTVALFAALAIAAGAAQAADVGVSVHVGEPGFYGRIDIGNVPRPQVIYPSPVIIAPAPVAVAPAPVYMRVPPGHAKHWARHCAAYGACGQPVYFVTDGWYHQTYAPYRPRREGYRHDPRDRDDHPGRGHGHHGRDRG